MVAGCRLVLAAIWLVAAWGKLAGPRAFLRAVLGFDLAPVSLVPWVAATMPGVELATGLVLLVAGLGALRPAAVPPGARAALETLALAAARISAALLALFTAALTVNLLRGVKMDCGCFDMLGTYLGGLIPALKPRNAGWDTVGRDVVMLLPALFLLRARRAR